MQEHDINQILKLNRISKFLHKLHLLPRQRRAIDSSRHFVVTNEDIDKEKPERYDKINIMADVDGFDPLDNAADRRLLFEVAAIRLNGEDFKDETSQEDTDGGGGIFGSTEEDEDSESESDGKKQNYQKASYGGKESS